jgi:hypothetical protein
MLKQVQHDGKSGGGYGRRKCSGFANRIFPVMLRRAIGGRMMRSSGGFHVTASPPAAPRASKGSGIFFVLGKPKQ